MIDDSKIELLKKYVINTDTKNSEKKVIHAYEENIDNYNMGVVCETANSDFYETYIYLSSRINVVSCLLYKKSWQYEEAFEYFKVLKEIILTKSIDKLLEECRKNSK